MLKAVVDANVWISGLIINQGNPARVLDLFRSGAFIVCCSAELLEELQDVLSRPKIAARIAPVEAQQLVGLLKAQALFVTSEMVAAACRDPQDEVYLACAAASDADVLISGDQDLLVLKIHGRTRILTPAEFVKMIKNES